MLSCECLVDNHHVAHFVHFLIGEEAAKLQRDVHCLKIVSSVTQTPVDNSCPGGNFGLPSISTIVPEYGPVNGRKLVAPAPSTPGKACNCSTARLEEIK